MFPINNYKKIDIPANNSNGSTVYTATADCFLFFMPIGARMEDDAPIGLYIDNWFTDSDGGSADNYLYYSKATTSSSLDLNVPKSDITTVPHGTSTSAFCPSGKVVKAYIVNSSDKIGGTLYVLELP